VTGADRCRRLVHRGGWWLPWLLVAGLVVASWAVHPYLGVAAVAACVPLGVALVTPALVVRRTARRPADLTTPYVASTLVLWSLLGVLVTYLALVADPGSPRPTTPVPFLGPLLVAVAVAWVVLLAAAIRSRRG
jgi:hypothetical protein